MQDAVEPNTFAYAGTCVMELILDSFLKIKPWDVMAYIHLGIVNSTAKMTHVIAPAAPVLTTYLAHGHPF